MRKKLLAGMLALALCSTNMPQTIFAGEFTSGSQEEVSEETSEIFTDNDQESAEEELSVFASESVPEFSNEINVMPAAADGTESITEIDLTETDRYPYFYNSGKWTITSGGSYRFIGTGDADHPTYAPIIINTFSNVVIYLNNVYINTFSEPALYIQSETKNANAYIYLENNNELATTSNSSLKIEKLSSLTINNSFPNNNDRLTVRSAHYAGIDSNSPLTISGGSVTAFSTHKAGISNNSPLTISGGSVTASSAYGAGISNNNLLTISGGSVTADSTHEAGISNNSLLTISGGLVTASSIHKAGISNNSLLTISGGSVTASSLRGAGISNNSNSSFTINRGSVAASSLSSSTLPKNTNGHAVYCCTIFNPQKRNIKIDNIDWETYNHVTGTNVDDNLYAWLTGEDHVITVGTNKTSYIFDSKSGTFSNNKRDITNDIFEFAGPYEFTYDGDSKTPKIIQKDTYKGVGNITVKYFKENKQITEPKDVGTYTIKIGVEEGDFYKATSSDLTNENWKFKINLGTLNPTITEHIGMYDGISYPVINIDQNTIPENSNIEYSVDNKQTWNSLNSNNDIPTVSTVKDAETTKIYIRIFNSNYHTWTSDEYKATISPATQAPHFPSTINIPVSWSCKKVGDVKNCFEDDWKWSDSDSSKELPVGVEISATAVYKGADAGNYLNNSVEFKITRSECTHEHTAGRYYSSPSCTSSGYSGDTYCTDCNETLSYGYTISAYGHDYDNGVITTEPTTETDGIITYTCKRCKHQDTKNLGKLGDGEPYIEGSFQKKGWDAVNDLIKASKDKDTISITLNGARTLPASVLSGIKGKDISLNLDMENGFIWKINGTSITAETPADIDLSVTNTAEHIPAALYSLISTNQNDFGFHLGRSGAFDFPAVLSVKADASCAGLMANLFWYDVENGVLQCIQTVTVGGAFERSIPYADFTLSKGQDYFIAFGTESLNGRVIHTDGSITDENGAYLRPANTKISSHSIDRNKLTVKLSKGCAGAQGYDFVISKKSNMLQTGKFSQTVSSTGKPQASFRYLAKGTWYVAARSWVLDAQGNKVYGSWTKIKKIKITVVTPQQPKIKNITVKGNTVTVTYTKCKNATGYEILLGNKYKTSAGEKYPVKKYVKRTEGKNTVTVTFTNVKKGTWYVTVRSWNRTSKNKSRVYSPYSTMKKFKTKK